MNTGQKRIPMPIVLRWAAVGAILVIVAMNAAAFFAGYTAKWPVASAGMGAIAALLAVEVSLGPTVRNPSPKFTPRVLWLMLAIIVFLLGSVSAALQDFKAVNGVLGLGLATAAVYVGITLYVRAVFVEIFSVRVRCLLAGLAGISAAVAVVLVGLALIGLTNGDFS